jgi:PDZ domain-containing secreted protein
MIKRIHAGKTSLYFNRNLLTRQAEFDSIAIHEMGHQLFEVMALHARHNKVYKSHQVQMAGGENNQLSCVTSFKLDESQAGIQISASAVQRYNRPGKVVIMFQSPGGNGAGGHHDIQGGIKLSHENMKSSTRIAG